MMDLRTSRLSFHIYLPWYKISFQSSQYFQALICISGYGNSGHLREQEFFSSLRSFHMYQSAALTRGPHRLDCENKSSNSRANSQYLERNVCIKQIPFSVVVNPVEHFSTTELGGINLESTLKSYKSIA